MTNIVDITKERIKRGMENASAIREVSTVVETDEGLFIFFTDGKCNFMETKDHNEKGN